MVIRGHAIARDDAITRKGKLFWKESVVGCGGCSVTPRQVRHPLNLADHVFKIWGLNCWAEIFMDSITVLG